jgi:hypothetical protein
VMSGMASSDSSASQLARRILLFSLRLFLKRADEVPIVAQRAFRTFVPTVRDQDYVCDFGAKDPGACPRVPHPYRS